MRFVFFLNSLYFLTISLSYGAFEINKLGPKASAFNDTYSTLASDSWGIIYNPAQVVRLEGAQASFGYSRPYLNFGNFQANLVSGFFTREALGTGYGLGFIFVDTNVFYREIVGLFNMGHRIGEKDTDWDLALGTNLKVLSLRRGDPTKPYDPALVPQTLNRVTADIGVHGRYQKFFVGLSAQNVIPANMGVVVRDIVPIETRVGVGAKEIWTVPQLDFKVSPAIEVTNRNQDTVATGGAEIELLDFANFVFGIGTRNISFGFSIFLNQLSKEKGQNHKKEDYLREGTTYRLDVGYAYPITGIETVGSPLLGMTFLF